MKQENLSQQVLSRAFNLEQVSHEYWEASNYGMAHLTSDAFWDCDCKEDYIQPKTVKHCAKCDTRPDAQPDSRINEILAEYFCKLTEERLGV